MTDQIKILLVANNQEISTRLYSALNPPGAAVFDFEVAVDVDSALQKVERFSPDALLLDFESATRPDKNQPNLTTGDLQKLRDRNPTLPIVLLAKSTDESLAVRALEMGADDYFLKDQLHPKWFSRAILHLVERSTMTRQITQLNAELASAKEVARAATKFKSEFLADVSHEIRTPMNAMIGMTDLLRRSPLNREQQKFVDIIQQSGRTLIEVINDILTLSKMEAGKFGLVNQVFDLRRLVESAAEMLSQRAREKDIYLTTFVATDLPCLVLGDGPRLRQVLLNLTANAIMETDLGRIELRVSLLQREGDEVQIKASITESEFDSPPVGTSVPSGTPSYISGRSVESESTSGLGFEISKRIIEIMGGTIWQDKQSKSSAVVFTANLSAAPANKDQEFDVEELMGRRLLFGNLQTLDREVLCEYTESLGIKYDIAESSASVVEHIDNLAKTGERYHLVILDLLASADTDTARAQLLNELAHKNSDLAVIRPFEEVGIIERVFELQVAHQLNKPLRQSQFISCLTNAIHYPDEMLASERETRYEDEILKSAKFDLSQRVLVVEDNQVNREVAKLQLRNLGLNPVLASGGMQALEEIGKCHYQFILMDCLMPKMDGYETTRRIRQLQKDLDKRSTIIALTANAMEGDRERCMEAGMDDFLSKPVTIEKLGQTLLKWQLRHDEINGTTDSVDILAETADQNKEIAEQVDTIGTHLGSPDGGNGPTVAGATESDGDDDDGDENEVAPRTKIESDNDLDLTLIKNHLVTTYGDGPGLNIFELFCSSTPNLIAQLESAWDLKDWTAFARTVHELKGQCSMVQADKLASLCKELERIIKSEERTAVERILRKLRDSYEKARVST